MGRSSKSAGLRSAGSGSGRGKSIEGERGDFMDPDFAKSRKSQRGGGGLRLLRLGENIRHVLSMTLARGDIRDPYLSVASVTVSEVRISPDLRHASVYVMPLGGDKEGHILAALRKNSAFLRGEISGKLVMKYIPALRFLLDESFDEASHINALLQNPHVQQDIIKQEASEQINNQAPVQRLSDPRDTKDLGDA